MGQDNTKPESQKNYTSTEHSSILPSARRTPLPLLKLEKRIQCEGLLTLRTTPFQNCIQIQTQSQLLFIENIETSLKMLLESRLRTNRLFMVEDIEKLIQTVTFTLAFLQEKGVTYRDVASENIFYDSGNFKLMPNELIESSTYQRLKMGDEVLPSPQLIIALRCGEQDVIDEDILEKSNLFTLGMIFLEVCTLQPSLECYDPQNYDILDSVVNERLILTQQYYGQRISRIIANMIDYDYSERMTLKEISIWINRQLQSSKPREQTQDHQISTSILASKTETKPLLTQNSSQMINVDKSKSRLTKNNSVYMNPTKQNNENPRQDRNRIYIRDNSRSDVLTSTSNYLYQGHINKNKEDYLERFNKTQEKRSYEPPFTDGDSFKFVEPPKQELRHHNPYCEEFTKITQKKDDFDRYMQKVERDTTQRFNKEPSSGYRVREYQQCQYPEDIPREQPTYDVNLKRQAKALKEVGNQFYPNIEEILKSKPKQQHQSNSSDFKGPLQENGTLNKIKEQIVKSRKLIEDMKINKDYRF